MPEGPEIRVITDQLSKILVNKYISNITTTRNDTFNKEINKNVVNVLTHPGNKIKITKIKCKGKLLYIQLQLFKNDKNLGFRYIANHLGMTGRWSIDEGNHTKMIITYVKDDQNQQIYFDDVRGFAKLWWLSKDELIDILNKLGPDVFSCTEVMFNKIINNDNIQNQMIGNVINDQSIIAGIGNYLRAEILYASKINPWSKIKDISAEKRIKLYTRMKEICDKSYNAGGSSKYVDVHGNLGKYQFLVYGKKIDKNNKIESKKLGSQTMWFVPAVQK